MEKVKLVVFVPASHSDIVRKALGESGAGKIGNYSHCTFISKGVGRYLALKGANPTIGKVGELEEVEEEKIETVCYRKELKDIIKAVEKVHPYEEVAFDIYPLLIYD